jgi:protein-S-isoprenylcysteine O-methyltransferase Ste14
VAVARRLLVTVVTRWLLATVVFGALLFLPAGTWDYWQGWAYFAALMVPMTFALVYFLRRDPAMVERRMKMEERATVQRVALALAGVGIYGSVLVAGLDRRFGWTHVPLPVVVIALVLVPLGYGLMLLVMRENSYASRVIEVTEGQRVISTGPYAVVRHPMYAGGIVMFLATPLALGSWLGLVPCVLMVAGLILRIVDEEKQLRAGLPGYVEYCEKVRHRLIPGVW